MGLKVGHKQHSSAGYATRPSPRGSLGPGARQDKSRHKPTSQVSQSVLRHGTVHPPPHACQQDTNPPQTTGQPTVVPVRTGYCGPARSRSPHCLWPAPQWHHPPAPARCPLPPWAQAQEAPRVSPPRLAPLPASKGFAILPLPAGTWGEDVPAPSPTPSPHPVPARSFPPLSATASMASAGPIEEASSGPGEPSALGGPRTSSRHPWLGTGCSPLLCRGDGGGGSVGAGRAIASPNWWVLSSEPATSS